MPHIIVRGVPEQELRDLSPAFKQVFVSAAQLNPDHLKIFYSPIRRVDQPEEVAVDVYWMPRPQELCDRVARDVTSFWQERGKGFVQVTFTEFPGPHFYENNQHF